MADVALAWTIQQPGIASVIVGARNAEQVRDNIDFLQNPLSDQVLRELNEATANLKQTLPIPDATYAGLVSSGTFTHGHVGAEALPELVRILARGALAVITVRPQVWTEMGFEPTFDALAGDGLVTMPEMSEEKIYADPDRAPEGHDQDTGYIVTFHRL